MTRLVPTRPQALDRRKHPSKYRAKDLERMLVEDGIAGVWSGYWLPRAEMVHGQWIVEACMEVSKRRRVSADRVFEESEAAIQAETGRGWPL